MPFTPSDYASALSAYAASLSGDSALRNHNPATPAASSERTHTSPAPSQSNRSSTAGRGRSSSRQSTPQRATPNRATPSASTTDASPLAQSSHAKAPSPKKQRLTPTANARKGKVERKTHSHTDTAAFYKVVLLRALLETVLCVKLANLSTTSNCAQIKYPSMCVCVYLINVYA